MYWSGNSIHVMIIVLSSFRVCIFWFWAALIISTECTCCIFILKKSEKKHTYVMWSNRRSHMLALVQEFQIAVKRIHRAFRNWKPHVYIYDFSTYKVVLKLLRLHDTTVRYNLQKARTKGIAFNNWTYLKIQYFWRPTHSAWSGHIFVIGKLNKV